MSARDCSDHQTLEKYVFGRLDSAQTESVGEHVDTCSDCDRTVRTIERETDWGLPQIKLVGAAVAVDGDHIDGLLEDLRRIPTCDSEPSHQPTHGDDETRHLVGQKIRQYELLELLGQGGMGAVYKARHARLNKLVALKMIRAGLLRGSQAVARFHREMLAVGRLDHPNIVRATDADEVDGRHFLVMEFIDGIDLSELVRAVGPLPVADACELVRQAAIGLQYAYEQGLVHRDIKPSNIMLCKSHVPSGTSAQAEDPDSTSSARKAGPTVKILDLGLALFDDHSQDQRRLTSVDQVMGTFDYMAPEQVTDSREVDIRADIYSLGATLYKLLCGRTPFAGEQYNTPPKVIVALATETPPSISSMRNDLPPELVTVVDRMLAKDPDARFSTPAEVVRALEPLAAGNNLGDLLATAEKLETEAPVDQSVIETGEYRSFVETDSKGKRVAQGVEAGDPPLRTGSSRRSTGFSRRARMVTLAAVAGSLLLLAAIIVISTKQGTITITGPEEGLPNDIEIVVKQDGEKVRVISKSNGWRVSIGPGPYVVELRGSDEFRLKDKELIVRRFGRNILTIERKPPPEAVAQVPIDKTSKEEPPTRPTPDEPLAASIGDPVKEIITDSGRPYWSPGRAENVLPGIVSRPALLPDGRRWNLIRSAPRNYWTPHAAWHPNGRHLAVTDNRYLRVYELRDGSLHLTHVLRDALGLGFKQVGWSFDGQWLAASSHGSVINTWKWPDPGDSIRRELGETFAWNPQQNQLVVVRLNRLSMWSPTEEKEHTIAEQESRIYDISWAPDGESLATWDKEGKLNVWSSEGKVLRTFDAKKGKRQILWSPDGKWLALARIIH